ncbi:MCE family protein [Maribacter polysiphoniae]|uniref:MCE family protein n=1 Tax=Maribacter polysiphoniae TaxID=429344 RepID=A0A316E4U3_9FLAO|nr:MlaD family protein [Maribacter polysiphoniae]MBD1259092.1 MCE family protein [Maribacter polysiphoniae]PWK24648.1 phospholipid/cholesterol/gamma-HCH transport system substrate-binding protein [Maribacter polysiphoniae]
MEKTTKENLKLGIFVVVGMTLLIIATYLIGNRQNMFGETITISAVFKNANGLQKGNNVRFSGIHVGTVKNLEMANDTTIAVYMVIDKKIQQHIKKDAVAAIGSDGLVGSMILNILPGRGTAAPIEEGDELQSYSRIATQDMLSTLNTTNENAAILTSDLLKVTQALIKGKGTMGRLLNDTIMANDLMKTIDALKNASANGNETIQKLNSMLDKIDLDKSAAGVVLSDSLNGSKMQNVIANLEQSSNDITQMTNNLNLVIKDAREGKGAVKYLANDTVFVNRLDTTMKNIEEGSIKFNENMEALKHNFLTRRYFKKLEKKQQKELQKE